MIISPRYDGPVILTIAGPPDDQLLPATRQRRRTATMLADLTEDDWATPSRCEGWTVKDVVAHLVGVNPFWQLSVTAALAGAPTRFLSTFDPAATPAAMVAGSRESTTADLLEQFVSSNDAFLDAIAGLTDEQWLLPGESPAGHVPLRLVVQHALWDCWVHERDIALPLGLAPAIEDDEVRSCLHYAAAVSPALAIGFGRPVAGTFAVDATDPGTRFVLDVTESVDVRDGAADDDVPCLRGAAVDLLEALSIRAPFPSTTPAEWLQLIDGLATAFDTEPRTGGVR